MADEDFSTGAELELTVSQSSLSDARDTIESELGDLEVDVNAVVSGNSMQPRDPSSGQFMAIEGVEQRVVNTNESLDGLVQIESERWELDKIRNDYLEDLADRSGVMGASSSGDGGGGFMGARAAVGAGGLSSVLGGLFATGAGIFGGRAALTGGVGGQTGRRVARERSQLTGASGIQMLQDNPGEFMAQSFKTMLDPSGIGETLATNVAQGIMDQTTLDENFSKGLDAAMGDLTSSSWPSFPDLSSQVQWPDPPQFDINPFDGQQQNSMQGVDTGGLLQRGGQGGGGPTVEPTINLGGISVDVTTSIESAVDDAVEEVETTVENEVGDLERRVADAIGGFF